eukprot:8525752-Lingulodinium_polyedra.AAC.1
MELLLKSNLQLHQRMREVITGLWVTFLLSSESGVAKAGDAIGAEYNAKIKEKGPGHNLGSPHAHILMGA